MIIVQRDERDVVPVLGLAPGMGSGCFGQQEAAKSCDVDFRLPGNAVIDGGEKTDLAVPDLVACTTQVHCPQILAASELDDRLRWLGVKVGQQFELHHCGLRANDRPPAPDMLIIGPEPGSAQGVFEPGSMNSPAADFKVDLDIDVCGACVMDARVGTEQRRDQPAKQDELGPAAIVVHVPAAMEPASYGRENSAGTSPSLRSPGAAMEPASYGRENIEAYSKPSDHKIVDLGICRSVTCNKITMGSFE
jgi:hypothetical protein